MKKCLSLTLSIFMLLSLVSCGGTADTETQAPDTSAPETDAPETDSPETDAPAVETEAPETDAPADDGGEDTPVEEEKDYTSVAAYYDEWLTAKALKVVEAE